MQDIIYEHPQGSITNSYLEQATILTHFLGTDAGQLLNLLCYATMEVLLLLSDNTPVVAQLHKQGICELGLSGYNSRSYLYGEASLQQHQH